MTEKRASAGTALTQDDISELLPWFATGRTTPAETQAIEQALSESAALRTELELVRRERHAEVESTQALGDPDPAVFEKVLAQLDGARQFKPIERDGADRAGFLSRLFGMTNAPALRIALAVACVAVVVEGVALFRTTAPSTSFQTASTSDQASGPRVIVRFAPNAGMTAVNAMLGDLNASVVKGPMPDGAYVIALPTGSDIDAVIKQLQAKSDLVAGADRGS
ncbi:MAG TPA: hypothetical protein VGM59_03145 [Dongiaceae bacterium]